MRQLWASARIKGHPDRNLAKHPASGIRNINPNPKPDPSRVRASALPTNTSRLRRTIPSPIPERAVPSSPLTAVSTGCRSVKYRLNIRFRSAGATPGPWSAILRTATPPFREVVDVYAIHTASSEIASDEDMLGLLALATPVDRFTKRRRARVADSQAGVGPCRPICMP